MSSDANSLCRYLVNSAGEPVEEKFRTPKIWMPAGTDSLQGIVEASREERIYKEILGQKFLPLFCLELTRGADGFSTSPGILFQDEENARGMAEYLHGVIKGHYYANCGTPPETPFLLLATGRRVDVSPGVNKDLAWNCLSDFRKEIQESLEIWVPQDFLEARTKAIIAPKPPAARASRQKPRDYRS